MRWLERGAVAVVATGLGLGASLWAGSARLTGLREPFDGPWAVYGAMTFLAGAIATLPSARHWWLAVPSVYLGEHLYAFLAYPDTRDWFVLGLFVNALVPTWLFTALGALLVRFVFADAIRRRAKRRAAAGDRGDPDPSRERS